MPTRVFDVEREIQLEQDDLVVQVYNMTEGQVPTLGICMEGSSMTATIFLSAEGLRKLGEEFVRIAESASTFFPKGG